MARMNQINMRNVQYFRVTRIKDSNEASFIQLKYKYRIRNPNQTYKRPSLVTTTIDLRSIKYLLDSSYSMS
jgi:hypothetical protein